MDIMDPDDMDLNVMAIASLMYIIADIFFIYKFTNKKNYQQNKNNKNKNMNINYLLILFLLAVSTVRTEKKNLSKL